MKRIKKRIGNYQAKRSGKFYAEAVKELGGIEYATLGFKNNVLRKASQLEREHRRRKYTIIKSVAYSIFTSIIASYIYQRLSM